MKIRKATRRRSKLRIGLYGPSGSGKTIGALMIAYGLCGDWDKIGMIDTEEGSGELYVGSKVQGLEIGSYNYLRISNDFSPINYINAISAMEECGCEVIIIDSLTHAWSGHEGLLDKQSRIASETKNSYTAWREVTPQHNKLVSAMLQSKANIIATMRSKTDYALDKGGDGKTRVVKLGMAPIQRDGMEYEFTTFIELRNDCSAAPQKDRTGLLCKADAGGEVQRQPFVISPAVGEMFKGWIESGEELADIVKIKELMATTRLDESRQGVWLTANLKHLANYQDALPGIITYLEGLKGKPEGDQKQTDDKQPSDQLGE